MSGAEWRKDVKRAWRLGGGGAGGKVGSCHTNRANSLRNSRRLRSKVNYVKSKKNSTTIKHNANINHRKNCINNRKVKENITFNLHIQKEWSTTENDWTNKTSKFASFLKHQCIWWYVAINYGTTENVIRGVTQRITFIRYMSNLPRCITESDSLPRSRDLSCSHRKTFNV